MLCCFLAFCWLKAVGNCLFISNRKTGVSEVAAEHIAASGMVGIEVITKIANHVLDGEGIRD
jgi:hypothetical protein